MYVVREGSMAQLSSQHRLQNSPVCVNDYAYIVVVALFVCLFV